MAPQQRKRPRVCEVSETDFFSIDGLRYVLPYKYEFQMTCKQRWLGRNLLDVFLSEFPRTDESYWASEFGGGRVLLNGKVASAEHVFGEHQTVVHVVHRHEPPVLDDNVVILHTARSFLVVNKPCTMPCHPCGMYRKNSLTFYMAARGWPDLKICHRLDADTSGIVILGRDKRFAQDFFAAMASHNVAKRYLALVQGEFPVQPVMCDEPLGFDHSTMRAVVDKQNGKSSHTDFVRVSFDSERMTSLVLCEPKTGRTHQIRVHLQCLQCPIVNDRLYNSESLLAATGSSEEATRDELRLDDPRVAQGEAILDTGTQLKCKHCPLVGKTKGDDEAKDYQLEADTTLRLHALQYDTKWGCFTTPVPEWVGSPDDAVAVADLLAGRKSSSS